MRTRGRTVGVVAVFAALTCALAGSAGAGSLAAPEATAVMGISPQHAIVGQLVTIHGSNLQGTRMVAFAGVPSASVTVDPAGTWVRAVVPPGMPVGPVSVTLNGPTFSLGPLMIEPGGIPPQANPKPKISTVKGTGAVKVVRAPRITTFSPRVAKPGARVTITGANFGHSLWVKFGGVRTHHFTVVGTTTIIAVVPRSAHSGKIKVHTRGGTSGSGQRFTLA